MNRIAIYLLIVLVMLNLILTGLNLSMTRRCIEPKDRLLLPVECLQNVTAVNQLFERLGIQSVRVLTPVEFEQQMSAYTQGINTSSIKLPQPTKP